MKKLLEQLFQVIPAEYAAGAINHDGKALQAQFDSVSRCIEALKLLKILAPSVLIVPINGADYTSVEWDGGLKKFRFRSVLHKYEFESMDDFMTRTLEYLDRQRDLTAQVLPVSLEIDEILAK